MKPGQTVGALIGHLTVVAGALCCLWAIARWFIWGNAADIAVGTVEYFILGSAFEGIGKVLVWFTGHE